MNIIKITLAAALAFMLSGCPGTMSGAQLPSGTVLCSEGVWGKVIGANINADVAGTRGGGFNVKCGAGEISSKDSGDLSPQGQTIRVPVEATPMKITPR